MACSNRRGILLFPLTYFLNDVITEVYGYKISRYILLSGLICQFLFALSIQLMLQLPMAPFLINPQAYGQIFGHLLTYSISFTLGTFAGQFINIYVVSKFKIFLGGKYSWLRSLSSTAVGEFIFSIITITPVLFLTHPFKIVIAIVLSAYLFKLFYGLVFIIPATLFVAFLKQAEGIDAYDYDVNYNPFILKIN